jgi:hypothetical protein
MKMTWAEPDQCPETWSSPSGSPGIFVLYSLVFFYEDDMSGSFPFKIRLIFFDPPISGLAGKLVIRQTPRLISMLRDNFVSGHK